MLCSTSSSSSIFESPIPLSISTKPACSTPLTAIDAMGILSPVGGSMRPGCLSLILPPTTLNGPNPSTVAVNGFLKFSGSRHESEHVPPQPY
jgi:hypothetical protein